MNPGQTIRARAERKAGDRVSPDLLTLVEIKGLRSAGQTLREISARVDLPEADCKAALDALIEQGRASPAHPRGRGLKREPTFKRGPSGRVLILRSASA